MVARPDRVHKREDQAPQLEVSRSCHRQTVLQPPRRDAEVQSCKAGVESTGLKLGGFADRSSGLRPLLTLVCSTVASAILIPLRKTDQRRANRIPCTVSHSVVTVSLGIGCAGSASDMEVVLTGNQETGSTVISNWSATSPSEMRTTFGAGEVIR